MPKNSDKSGWVTAKKVISGAKRNLFRPFFITVAEGNPKLFEHLINSAMPVDRDHRAPAADVFKGLMALLPKQKSDFQGLHQMMQKVGNTAKHAELIKNAAVYERWAQQRGLDEANRQHVPGTARPLPG